MATDRQTIMETNRSLRTIKNELENLLEKGVIDDETYENIHSILPAEAPLRGARAPAPATPSNTANPTSPPTDAMSNLNIESQRGISSPAPPSYSSSTGAAAAAGPPPGPPPAPTKPVIAHARALYRYNASDSRDLTFERDDKIQVHEYMNADWWMGRNTRTGAEGIFPKTYVAVEHTETQQPRAQPGYGPPTGQPGYSQYGYNPQPAVQQLWPPPGQQQQQQQQYPPPGPPPQQQQQQQNQENHENHDGEEKKDGAGKAKEYGEKFGKKLGNAAIFGAGATLGSNLVNSIF